MFYSAYRHRRLEESDLLTKVSFGSKADAPHAIALATDMCMVHGRFPSTKVAFCSKELKRDQLTKQVHLPLLDAGGTRRADIASPGRTFRGIRVVQGRHGFGQREKQRPKFDTAHPLEQPAQYSRLPFQGNQLAPTSTVLFFDVCCFLHT